MAHFAGADLKHGWRLSVDGLPAARSDGDKPDFKELDLTSLAVSISPTTSSSSSSDSNRRRRPGTPYPFFLISPFPQSETLINPRRLRHRRQGRRERISRIGEIIQFLRASCEKIGSLLSLSMA